MNFQPFTWGSGGQKASPSSVKRQAEIAAALAAKSGAPQNVGQGLSRVGEALLHNSMVSRSEAGAAEGAAEREAIMSALMGNPDPGMSDIASALGNEWVTSDPGSSAIVQALLGQEMQQNDPLRQLQIEGARLGNETAAFELDQARNAPAPVPGAPEVKTIFDEETGREQMVQWNGQTGEWDPIGGVQAPKDPLVQVNTGDGADSALNKALSGKEGESWASYKEAGAVSGSNFQDFEILGELMALAPQGPITGRLADAFKGFSSAGDAAKSIIRRIAPTLRAPGSGSTSDIEYQGMLDSLPSLINDPAANTMILAIMQAKAQLNMERGEIVTAYQNGDITVGEARTKMDELNRRSIMSPEMRRALLGVGDDGNMGAPPPNVGEEVDGYIYQGGDPASPSSWKQVM